MWGAVTDEAIAQKRCGLMRNFSRHDMGGLLQELHGICMIFFFNLKLFPHYWSQDWDVVLHLE